MKIRNEERNIISTFGGESKAFEIKTSKKAFKILSDGLYSNKIRAIIRELSTNALDSHIQAGKSDIPFEITLPNLLNPTFKVQDFGVGLSKNEVENLYTTYFESTKTNSNDVIGALGLGSKSPFSYTETFMVESIKDNIKVNYLCFIDKDGIPSVQLINETQTDEKNGVSVSFKVQKEDFKSFYYEASKVLRPFKVKPIIKGKEIEIDIYNVFEDFDFSDFKVLNKSYRSEWIAVQGFIEYEVNKDIILQYMENTNKDSEDYKIISLLNEIPIPLILNFKIGELDISASRESLSYDDITINNIIDKLKDVYFKINNHIKEKLDKLSKDSLEFKLTYYKYKSIFHKQYWGVSIYPELFLKNTSYKDVTEDYHIKNNSEDYVALYQKNNYNDNVRRITFVENGSIRCSVFDIKNSYFVVQDKSDTFNKAVTKARHFLKIRKDLENVFLISESFAEKLKLPKDSKRFKVISTKDIELSKKKKSEIGFGKNFYTPKEYEPVFREINFKENETYYFIPVISRKIDANVDWTEDLDLVVRNLKDAGLLENFIFTRSRYYYSKKFQNSKIFNNGLDKIKEILENSLKDKEFIEEIKKIKFEQTSNSRQHNAIFTLLLKSKDKEIVKLAKEFKSQTINYYSKNYYLYAALNCTNLMKEDFENEDLKRKVDEFFDKYPLLKFIDTYVSPTSEVQLIEYMTDYIVKTR